MLTGGAYLVDANREEERFRVKELLFDAGDYQIALAEDTAMDDKLVCAKTIAYDAARMQDKKYVAMRRKALNEELKFLARPVHLLPEPLDWIQLEHSETVLGREPVLIYEYIHGDTLHDLVTTRFPQGIAPARAIRIAHEICAFLVELHKDKWVYRNLDPRHVIIGHDDVIHFVGCGNATPLGEPPNESRIGVDSGYIAPETRGETSGAFLRPAADIFSLGALLSFLVTGEEPRSSTENPLSQAAFDRLSAMDPPGVSLLVARCMRPMAKQRIGRAERLLPYLTMDSLPTPTSKGFGMLQLPAPWTGAERPTGRLEQNRLSAGPLLSVSQPANAPAKAEVVRVEAEKQQLIKNPTKDRSAIYYVGFFVVALFLCVLSFLIPGL